jgi:hypothetical protein
MNTGDIAREQIRDRVRDADAFRQSRATRKAQRNERTATGRKFMSGFVAVLASPFRQ